MAKYGEISKRDRQDEQLEEEGEAGDDEFRHRLSVHLVVLHCLLLGSCSRKEAARKLP